MSDCNLEYDDCGYCYKTENLLEKIEKENLRLKTELAQLKELLATRNTDLRDAIDENSKLKEKCDDFEDVLHQCFKGMHLDYYGNPVIIADFESEVHLIKEVLEKYRNEKL